jgi:short-subunit dehydrogenase
MPDTTGRPLRRRTALVTGASSGIGAAFARRLGREGYDLVLVARNRERLEAVADEVRAASGVEVETMLADLGNHDELRKVEERVASEPALTLLVNNAGFGTAGRFADLDPGREEELVRVNVTAVVRLTRAALPGMLARGRGTVVNVSSVAGFQPGPYAASYSASKAFLNSFTQAVHEELRGTGVRMQLLAPGFTITGFQQRAGIDRRRLPAGAWMTAEQVVDASVRGLRRRQLVVVPGLRYRALTTISKLAPGGLVLRVAGRATRRYRTGE